MLEELSDIVEELNIINKSCDHIKTTLDNLEKEKNYLLKKTDQLLINLNILNNTTWNLFITHPYNDAIPSCYTLQTNTNKLFGNHKDFYNLLVATKYNVFLTNFKSEYNYEKSVFCDYATELAYVYFYKDVKELLEFIKHFNISVVVNEESKHIFNKIIKPFVELNNIIEKSNNNGK